MADISKIKFSEGITYTIKDSKAVHTYPEELTLEEKNQVRENIGSARLTEEGSEHFQGDIYANDTEKVATENYVLNLYQNLSANKVLRFYCIEDVAVVVNGVSTTYPANSNVEMKFTDTDVYEIVPTSNHSILALNSYPGALGTYHPWLEGVKQFANILFDMNDEAMYSKWSQGNQGSYQVQYAQYTNCIFWSDNPYISDVSKRTNYTIYYST